MKYYLTKVFGYKYGSTFFPIMENKEESQGSNILYTHITTNPQIIRSANDLSFTIYDKNSLCKKIKEELQLEEYYEYPQFLIEYQECTSESESKSESENEK